MLPASKATPARLQKYSQNYNRVTNVLRTLKEASKDQTRTLVPVFEIEINSNDFITSLPREKFEKAIAATGAALLQKSLPLKEAQGLIGYLSFYAKVVRLGWVFMASLLGFLSKLRHTKSWLEKTSHISAS